MTVAKGSCSVEYGVDEVGRALVNTVQTRPGYRIPVQGDCKQHRENLVLLENMQRSTRRENMGMKCYEVQWIAPIRHVVDRSKPRRLPFLSPAQCSAGTRKSLSQAYQGMS